MTAPTDTTPPSTEPTPSTEQPTPVAPFPSPVVSSPDGGGGPGEQVPASPHVPDPAAGAGTTPEPPTPSPADGQAPGGQAAGGGAGSDEEVDLAAILPTVDQLTVGGIYCEVRRIKLRELMLLAQIVGAALGQGLSRVDFTGMTDDKMFALAVVALPNAEPELRAFLRAVVVARDPAEHNAVQQEMENPGLEDTLAIAGVLLQQEREEFGRLGKHLQQMVKGLQALWRTGKRGT